nr:anti-sigma factor [Microlunatus panaciterrae]
MVSPRAEVWERIQAELRDELPGAQSRPEQTSAPQTSAQQMSTQPSPETNVVALDRTRRARPDRRWILRAVAAAVIGVLLGVVGTVTLRDGTTEQVQVLARTVLEPLPGKTGSGSAELVTIDHQPFLRITVKGLGAGAGYHELWLINSDGKRMVSLGVLPENTTKTYPLPAGLGSSYRIVDVSLEPDDGNPLHSHNSLVRGTLPL